ncbi:MAG: low molecular weight protein-tyrosine-phosphatase [Candidatus Krumholzibacteriia bacterium]
MDREHAHRERTRILVVCYGNICRSPTAEALLRRELDRAGLGPQYEVGSAGVRALHGNPAAPGALQTAAQHGVLLDEHRARQLTPEMALQADVVIAMDEVVEEEILILSGDDIPIVLWAVDDPYGGPDEGYERAFEEIRSLVRRYVDDRCARAEAQ